MFKFSIFFLIVFGLILMACSDKKSDKEYFEAGYDSYNNEKYEEALTNFKLILENYPKSEFSAKAMFMIGFINANHLKNFDEAKKYYEEFIKKFADHELVASAQYELKTLGKDIEELPIFQKIEESDSTTASE